MPKRTDHCVVCGDRVVDSPFARFCGGRCYSLHHAQTLLGVKAQRRTPCATCGFEFKTTNARQRYCSRKCNIAACHSRRSSPEPNAISLCRHCGAMFIPNRRQQIYCDKACNSAHRAVRRPPTPQTICQVCGATFTGKTNRAALYCSTDCKKVGRNANNVHKRNVWDCRRRARLRGAKGVFVKEQWLRIVRRASGCYYCGAESKLTMDHVVPLSRGGDHTEGNIVPACERCNFQKGAKLIIEWRYWKSQQAVA